MGKLTRRVKYIAKERRLSIPAEFLHTHGIERGDQVVASCLQERLYIFPVLDWERFTEVAEHVDLWFPEPDHPFFAIVRSGVKLRLGSQDRIVLPKNFPFRMEKSTRMFWDLQDGVLAMEPEHSNLPERGAFGEPTTQRSLLDLVAPSTNENRSFDLDRARDELVEDVSVARIDHRDRTFADAHSIPGEELLRSIKVEGVRIPLVLRTRENGSYQIIQGFRRVTAARQLRVRSVPAVVWNGINDQDARRIKVMEGTRRPDRDNSPLQRLQSTVRLHESQTALHEIERITGRRKRTLQRYLRVNQEPAVREAINSGRLSIFKAEEILKAGLDPEEAIREGWTVKKIRELGKKTGKRRIRRNHGSQSPD